MPKVSVCIPTYNQTIYLKKCIESLAMQTFTDYEIIISDDSTTNEVKNYIDTLTIKNTLHYFSHSPSLGAPANWNYSMSKAKGDYIKILHHDDFFTHHDSLKQYVELLDKNPQIDFAFSASVILNHQTQKTKQFRCSSKNLTNLQKQPGILFFENLIGAPSATIFRNKKNNQFDVTMKWLVDIDFYITQLRLNTTIGYSNEPLITTLHGGDGQTTQTVINDKNIQLKEHVLLFEKLFDVPELQKGFKNYFTELFLGYKIKSVDELQNIIPLSDKLQSYFFVFFKTLQQNYIFKKIKIRLFNSHINTNYLHFKTY